jgi:hypothetical protein
VRARPFDVRKGLKIVPNTASQMLQKLSSETQTSICKLDVTSVAPAFARKLFVLTT